MQKATGIWGASFPHLAPINNYRARRSAKQFGQQLAAGDRCRITGPQPQQHRAAGRALVAAAALAAAPAAAAVGHGCIGCDTDGGDLGGVEWRGRGRGTAPSEECKPEPILRRREQLEGFIARPGPARASALRGDFI